MKRYTDQDKPVIEDSGSYGGALQARRNLSKNDAASAAVFILHISTALPHRKPRIFREPWITCRKLASPKHCPAIRLDDARIRAIGAQADVGPLILLALVH